MRISTTEMNIKDWISIDDNPVQRDTQIHAKKALKKHLKITAVSHRTVAGAIDATGKQWKLDGHTRSYLWETGELKPDFDTVYVTWFHVQNVDQVIKLYREFDNVNAVETSRESMTGIYKYFDIPNTGLAARINAATALQQIYSGSGTESRNGNSFSSKIRERIYEDGRPFVEPFVEEFKIMASLRRPTQSRFNSGNAAALILTLAADRANNYKTALNFWEQYVNDEGFMYKGKLNGVAMLSRVMNITTSKGLSKLRQTSLGMSLACYERYVAEEMTSKRPRAKDPMRYIAEELPLISDKICELRNELMPHKTVDPFMKLGALLEEAQYDY